MESLLKSASQSSISKPARSSGANDGAAAGAPRHSHIHEHHHHLSLVVGGPTLSSTTLAQKLAIANRASRIQSRPPFTNAFSQKHAYVRNVQRSELVPWASVPKAFGANMRSTLTALAFANHSMDDSRLALMPRPGTAKQPQSSAVAGLIGATGGGGGEGGQGGAE